MDPLEVNSGTSGPVPGNSSPAHGHFLSPTPWRRRRGRERTDTSRSTSPSDGDKMRKWFFGRISREEAENILRTNLAAEGKEGDGDGKFLVRERLSSPPGDEYVLTRAGREGQMSHHQIRKCGSDEAFFCLSEGPVIHGLDTLIEQLKGRRPGDDPVNPSLELSSPCGGGLYPPPEARLHGKTNLLHRAVAEADVRVVIELLASMAHNLEAKNEKGRTALHMACLLPPDKPGRPVCGPIVSQLLRRGARVDCRDSTGKTPLYCAAIANNPSAADWLLSVGNADPQIRRKDSGWVPLHEAAYLGHYQVIGVLLANGAPLYPRTDQNETPLTLAKKMNHKRSSELLESYVGVSLISCPPREEWLHESLIDRRTTESLLRASGLEEGMFLVRKSKRSSSLRTLALVSERRVYCYQIQRQDIFYFIDNGPYWPSLEQLVTFYSKNANGLPTRLTAPVRVPPEIDAVLIPGLLPPPLVSPLKPQVFPLIDRKQLKCEYVIGRGEFGTVFRAIWRQPDGTKRKVAVKVARKGPEINLKQRRDQFKEEMRIMTVLESVFIVKLLGVCAEEEPLMMVSELLPMGCLLLFLKEHPSEIEVDFDLKLWSSEIAFGMKYLEQKGFIHRDLAARNILLFNKRQVKISDFGFSRFLSHSDYYKSTSGGMWPIKWCAPESIRYCTFTHASDVWSYGVTLWELYSFGEHPYANIDGAQMLTFLDRCRNLERPSECPDKVFGLMLRCWFREPENRPAFGQICEHILSEPFYDNIREVLDQLR